MSALDDRDRPPAPAHPLPDRSLPDPARAAAAAGLPPAVAAVLVTLTDPPPAIGLGLLLVAAGVAAWAASRLVVGPLLGALDASRAGHARTEVQLLEERADRELRARLERALRHAESEPAALRVGLRAIAETVPDGAVELLLSVPGEPRVGWRVPLRAGELEDAVPVPGSPACAALAEGSPVVTTTTSLDACAHLGLGAPAGGDAGPDARVEVAAACVPLRSGEELTGTVCITTAPGEPLDEWTLERIEWIVDRIGLRTAEHRALTGDTASGHPDPLTGLPDAIALRPHLKEMVRSLTPFCLAIVEIDRFEELESDADADAALVSLAQVLCDTVRPDDVICRRGSGFAVVLGGCNAAQAVSIMERVRERLALTLTESALVEPSAADVEDPLPAVTCSMGVVESRSARSLEEIVERAVAACDHASDAGGNRVWVAAKQ